MSRSEEIIELYHNFILSLLTSKNDFLMLCLSKIIGCFTADGEIEMKVKMFNNLNRLFSTDDEGELWVGGNPSQELDAKLQLVHNLIKKTLDVMPMVPVTMKKQIRIEFPYYKQPNFKIVAYIHNLLKMLDYCPNMMHDVLELIFENLLLIDVNVTREQIEQSEESDCDDDSDDEDERMKLPVAETLDICMEKVLGYFKSKLCEDSTIDKELQKVMTQAIFHYFDEQIIKTYTKHVHFVLFYIASLKVN